ncbi:molybdate ABC transporter permease subunit [Collinsella sp. An2]|uniref:molybdate ABC transporter permease subunit n=1 Tax=Collinsella sp. An2 TaxID=1965585 RepID=UPI001EF59829|nr:molybdate ABC transporter permease subunit [Collinsella sp. An2]
MADIDNASMRGGAAALSLLLRLVCALTFAMACLLVPAHPSLAWAQDASTSSQDERAVADSAVDDEAGFGLNGFVRNNAGTERAVEDVDLGYRLPLSEGNDLVVVNTSDEVLVYVDTEAAASAGFAIDDPDDVSALRTLIEELDETHSRGGALLKGADKPWTVTSDAEVVRGAYRYRFCVEAAGRSYTSVVPAELPDGADPGDVATSLGLDLGDAVLWSDNAALVSAGAAAREATPTFFEEAQEFFGGIDYRPFWVSLKTSALALVFTFVLGLVAAWKTMGTSSRLKGVLDSVFTIPMVLPPTVCGFLLMLFFGQSTAIGRWLIAHGIDIVFTWPAAVVSAVVVSFPLMYRTALGAFEALDPAMLDAARTLGWSEARIFRTLMLPLAWPSIAAGTVLAFARAMGEFGCTLFFAGNYAGVTQTIPIAIYFQWMGGSSSVALFWVVVVIVFSFLVILFINLYTAHSQAYRRRGLTRAERRQLAVDARRGGDEPSTASDGLESQGGDALVIDREALRALLADEERAGGGAPSGVTGGTSGGNVSPSSEGRR